MKTRIKICGITRLEDALAAIENGADALGFVFYTRSPRYISPAHAAAIIRGLPPFVTTVGLFVNPEQSYLNDAVVVSGIDVIQLHGDESPEFCASQERRVIKALPVTTSQDLAQIRRYQCPVLLDAKAPEGVYGGTGHAFDWSLLAGLDHPYPCILAGGLNADNLAEALSLRQWYGVDVSSGVELSKGIKDASKMDAFCKIVHEFNCRV